jgi:hypothetical protein
MSLLNLTFQRASASGAYLGKNGLLNFAPTDEPVLEFNTNGTFRGYRVRTPRTNLLLRSEEFDNAYWSKASGTIAPNSDTAPDGLQTADKYVVNDGGTLNSPIVRLITLNTNTTYTLSLFVKKADYDTASIRIFTTETGFATCSFNLSTATASGGTIESVGNGWFRVSVTLTTLSTASNGQIQIIRDAQIRDGVAGIFIWGAQLEAGNTATPYIQTTSSAVTTSPEIAFLDPATSVLSQVSGSIFIEWENPVAETVYLDDFEFQVVAGVNQLRFDYSPTVKAVTINGVQLEPITGDFDFTGLDRIEVGNFDGDLQPDGVFFRAIRPRAFGGEAITSNGQSVTT